MTAGLAGGCLDGSRVLAHLTCLPAMLRSQVLRRPFLLGRSQVDRHHLTRFRPDEPAPLLFRFDFTGAETHRLEVFRRVALDLKCELFAALECVPKSSKVVGHFRHVNRIAVALRAVQPRGVDRPDLRTFAAGMFFCFPVGVAFTLSAAAAICVAADFFERKGVCSVVKPDTARHESY